jgi:hypothetical protein
MAAIWIAIGVIALLWGRDHIKLTKNVRMLREFIDYQAECHKAELENYCDLKSHIHNNGMPFF